MKRYLLASAGGAGLLWVFCGLLPVKALSILERTNTNIAPEADGSSYQESDVHDSNSANNVASKLIVADGTNQKQTNEDLGNNPAANSSPSITAPSQNSSQPSNALAQVTSVSQLSDVQPTDWAFQALQSLVERYGCIAGYPNSTYRGNRAMTRYEFAAGLNACLERVNELIATATTDLVKKEDLATLQKLQEEFSAELATLRGRVDALEARTTELEANQFSTTTKLNGEPLSRLWELAVALLVGVTRISC